VPASAPAPRGGMPDTGHAANLARAHARVGEDRSLPQNWPPLYPTAALIAQTRHLSISTDAPWDPPAPSTAPTTGKAPLAPRMHGLRAPLRGAHAHRRSLKSGRPQRARRAAGRGRRRPSTRTRRRARASSLGLEAQRLPRPHAPSYRLRRPPDRAPARKLASAFWKQSRAQAKAAAGQRGLTLPSSHGCRAWAHPPFSHALSRGPWGRDSLA
jgi:hypothetical protein